MNDPALAVTAAPRPTQQPPASLTTGMPGPLLQRLLSGGRDGADRLIADLQKGARELAALSLNYNGHSIRAGVHSAAMSAIDAELDAAASALARALFELQQRLLLDVQALTQLARIEQVVDLEDDRPLPARIRDRIDAYAATLGPSLGQARTTVTAIAARLRVLANNTEIAACRADDSSGAPVDLFVAIAGQMRALALRLRAVTDDLAIFEQTQSGNVEVVRVALQEESDDEALGRDDAPADEAPRRDHEEAA